MKLVYMRVGFSKEVELFAYEDSLEVRPHLLYIVETRHGKDMASMELSPLPIDAYQKYQEASNQFFKVLKPANKDEIRKRREMKEKSKECFDISLKKIKEHGLPIKLINVYYFFEGNKILFNFYSDTRVDFRALVKDLAGIFKTRIELHQVGIRDFSQFFNQIGVCGRAFCCSTVKTHKNSISLKMAKEQNLHINASKLSGVCGRLMCCLNYEYDSYKGLYKNYPEIGEKIQIKGKPYFVKEINHSKEVIYVFNAEEEFEEISLSQFLENKQGNV